MGRLGLSSCFHERSQPPFRPPRKRFSRRSGRWPKRGFHAARVRALRGQGFALPIEPSSTGARYRPV